MKENEEKIDKDTDESSSTSRLAKARKLIEEAVLEGEVEPEQLSTETKTGSHQFMRRVSFSGPLPPPDLLAKYKEVQSDLPERIMKLTEIEAAHRHRVTGRALNAEIIYKFAGQLFGLIVALAALGTTAYLASLGHPGWATALGGGTIVALVAVFITGRVFGVDQDDGEDED